MKTAYIVSLYFGARRTAADSYVKDRLAYLKLQLEALKKVKHHFDLVIFVINQDSDSDESIEYTEQAWDRIRQIKGYDWVVHVRNNKGFSYGAWQDAIQLYCKNYDFAMLIEDDYIPVVDEFDLLYQSYFTADDIGYVCQMWSLLLGTEDMHAAISNGMIRLRAFWESGGFDLNAEGDTGADADGFVAIKRAYGVKNQEIFLRKLVKNFWQVVDTRDKQRHVFIEDAKSVVVHGNEEGLEVLVPVLR